MKILLFEYAKPAYTFVTAGDDAISRNADFYVPDFVTELTCIPQFIFKIDRLGKHINPRFAHRYYNRMAAGLIFRADNIMQDLQAMSLPNSISYTFENSFYMSELSELENDCEIKMFLNGEKIYSLNICDLSVSSNEILAKASEYHLIKIGDIFTANNGHIISGLKLGDLLELYLNAELKLSIGIK